MKILGYEFEKSEMITDLISAINFNRRVSMLKDWKIIDDELKKQLMALLEVRNGLAHKFSIGEINYKDKRLINYSDESNFVKFTNDLEEVWKKFLKIYENEEMKIDFDKLIQEIQDAG